MHSIKPPISRFSQKPLTVLYYLFGLALLSPNALAQSMCTVQGSDGPCQVSANLAVILENGGVSATCQSLRPLTYEGRCTAGQLEGPVTLRYDFNGLKTAHHGAFKAGQVPEYAIRYIAPYAVSVDHHQAGRVTRYHCLQKGMGNRPPLEDLNNPGCSAGARLYGAEWISYDHMTAMTSPLPKNNPTDDAPVLGGTARGG